MNAKLLYGLPAAALAAGLVLVMVPQATGHAPDILLGGVGTPTIAHCLSVVTATPMSIGRQRVGS